MGDRLKSKAAVVTGAGSGIGRACALRFAAEGARVVVNDVRPEAADAVVKEIQAAGGTASAFPGDVGSSKVVDAMIAAAAERYGALDVLVNNAAAPRIGWIAETSDEDWRAVHAVTLDGAFYGVRAALRLMLPRGKGSIVSVASGAGVGAEYMLGAYGSAKAGLIQMSKTAAVEAGARGVRVNVICPGSIATPPLLAWAQSVPGGRENYERQIPAGRIGLPEEVANVALFLASDESSYVTGAVYAVDGGVTAKLASPRVG